MLIVPTNKVDIVSLVETGTIDNCFPPVIIEKEKFISEIKSPRKLI
nr:MAG TPA: hypothetical protein [Caudoviricetes sp.]DAI70719.1 MAG TPA: hypothetical protein [Caudoviricetes sp.]DAL75609.1 MAG TPA: hypothetical protein [Caudoviricetes sp.]DAL85771.1 MAG TPA: hypothetical protein [Caudoviricetes sp.]DAQ42239.1 MAG TPA: hypothetical protein [Caudoviricetes sp.]